MRLLIVAAAAASSLLMATGSSVAEDQRNPVWDIYPSYQLSINANRPDNPANDAFMSGGTARHDRRIVTAPQVTGSIGIARPSPRLEPGAVDLREWQLHNSAR